MSTPAFRIDPSMLTPTIITTKNGEYIPGTNNIPKSRGRLGSHKRMRTDQGDDDRDRDLPKDADEKLDGLLIAAAAAMTTLDAYLADKEMDPISQAVKAVYAVVEYATENRRKLAPQDTSLRSRQKNPTPPASVPSAEDKLKAVLREAEKTAIVFEADLGDVAISSRDRLTKNFNAGLAKAVRAKATADGADDTEAFRQVNDALECIKKVDFLSVCSAPNRGRTGRNAIPAGTFFTAPTKIEFSDKSERINFENKLRIHCNMRATISLPKPVREEQKWFHDSLLKKAIEDGKPDTQILVRLDTENLCFSYSSRNGFGEKWVRAAETHPIPHDIEAGCKKQKIVLPNWRAEGSMDH